MHRAKSLLLSESAFFSAAVASVTDQEKLHGGGGGDLVRRYSSFNLESVEHNEDIIQVLFCQSSCIYHRFYMLMYSI